MSEARVPDPDDVDATRRVPKTRKPAAAGDDTLHGPGAPADHERTVQRPPKPEVDATIRRPATPAPAPAPVGDDAAATLRRPAAGADDGATVRRPAAPRKPVAATDDTVHSGDPLIGKTLGGCRIEAVIGAGGMGTVYRARQLSLDRIVAVKTIRPEYATDAESIERFRREAKAVGKFKTPHVVQIYQVGHELGVPFIVLEYVPGGSLRDFAEKQPNKRVSSDDAIRFLREAALGLSDAAEKGIVHRDIKPDNMLLDERGTLKIADFGISKVVQQDVSMTLTMGGIVGTPLYMSPEQCRGDAIDHRSDMWSLGATFFYLLTGNPPAKGSSLLELIRTKNEVLSLDPAKILPREIPGALSEIVRRLTMLKREDRYATYAELLADLDTVAAGRRPRRPLSRGLVRAVVAVGVLGGVGAVGAANWETIHATVTQWFAAKPVEPPPPPPPTYDFAGMRKELVVVGDAVDTAADEAALIALTDRVNRVRDELARVPDSPEARELKQSVGDVSRAIGDRMGAMRLVEEVKGFRDRLDSLRGRADLPDADLPTIRTELRSLIDQVPTGESWNAFRDEANGALRIVAERHYRKRIADAEASFVADGPGAAGALTQGLVGDLANESTTGAFVEIADQATKLNRDVNLGRDLERVLVTRPAVVAPFVAVQEWTNLLATKVEEARNAATTAAFASWVGNAYGATLTDPKLHASVTEELARVWQACRTAQEADDVAGAANGVQTVRESRSNLAGLRGFDPTAVIADADFIAMTDWLRSRSATDEVVGRIDAAVTKARETGSLTRWLSTKASVKAERDDLAGRAAREELAGDDRLPKAVARLDAEIAVWTKLEERVRGALDAIGKAGLGAASVALQFGDVTDRDVGAIAEIATTRKAIQDLRDGFAKLFGRLDIESARAHFEAARSRFGELPEGLGAAAASKYAAQAWERARVLDTTVRDGGMAPVQAGHVRIAVGQEGFDNEFDVVAFYIDPFEVDCATFKAVLDAGGLRNVSAAELAELKRADWTSRPRLPALAVSRVAAEDCLRWLGDKRLPRHEEWWLATKGPGDNQGFPWGDRWDAGAVQPQTVPDDVNTDRVPTDVDGVAAHFLVGNAAEWLANDVSGGSRGALAGGGIGDSLNTLRDRARGKLKADVRPTDRPVNAGFRGVIRPREFFGALAPID